MRDGSHSISHQYDVEHVRVIAKGLDEAGVEIVEISHGDGLGGSSINYGFERCTDEEKLRAAASVMKKSKLAVSIAPWRGDER